MKGIANYLEYTFLKTSRESGLNDLETFRKLGEMLVEAYENNFHAVVMRQRYLRMAHRFNQEHSIDTKLVTVVSFPLGINTLEEKRAEVIKSLYNQADEMDIVINYRELIAGNFETVKTEIAELSPLVLEQGKEVKWIIESAALTDGQIVEVSKFIRNWVLQNVAEENRSKVFIKTSTGYFRTAEGATGGAKLEAVKLIRSAAPEINIKASGGIKNRAQAEEFISAGASRIGTSSAMEILFGPPPKD